MIVTEDFANQQLFKNDTAIGWGSKDINPELDRLSGKNITVATGTGAQILKLLKVTVCVSISVTYSTAEEIKELEAIAENNNFRIVMLPESQPMFETQGIISDNLWCQVSGTSNPSIFRHFRRFIAYPGFRQSQMLDKLMERLRRGDISKLRVAMGVSNELILAIIAESTNLTELSISQVNQQIIEAFGRANIESVSIMAIQNSYIKFCIDPILTNPSITHFRTNIMYKYNRKAEITLMGFVHTDIRSKKYKNIEKICKANSEKRFYARIKPALH